MPPGRIDPTASRIPSSASLRLLAVRRPDSTVPLCVRVLDSTGVRDKSFRHVVATLVFSVRLGIFGVRDRVRRHVVATLVLETSPFAMLLLLWCLAFDQPRINCGWTVGESRVLFVRRFPNMPCMKRVYRD